MRAENHPSHWGKISKDVSWGSCFFPTHHSSTKLTNRLKEIKIVASNKILWHHYNRLTQTDLTMMIGWMLSYITCKLSDLNFLPKFSFEASIYNLSLTRFEAINQRWNWTKVICYWEMNQLLIYEIIVPQFLDIVINENLRVILWKPIFTIISLLFIKG